MATAPAKVWAGPIPSDGRLPLSFRELVERAPLQLNNDGTRKQASKQASNQGHTRPCLVSGHNGAFTAACRGEPGGDQFRDGSVGSAYGDAVSLSQRLFGGQGVAPLKDPALDGSTEIGGNLSVRTVVIRWPSECPP